MRRVGHHPLRLHPGGPAPGRGKGDALDHVVLYPVFPVSGGHPASVRLCEQVVSMPGGLGLRHGGVLLGGAGVPAGQRPADGGLSAAHLHPGLFPRSQLRLLLHQGKGGLPGHAGPRGGADRSGGGAGAVPRFPGGCAGRAVVRGGRILCCCLLRSCSPSWAAF